MKITITAGLLCELCGGKFTFEACEALCDYFDEMFGDSFAPALGDIFVSYSEIGAEDIDEDDEEKIIIRLDNGNVLLTL